MRELSRDGTACGVCRGTTLVSYQASGAIFEQECPDCVPCVQCLHPNYDGIHTCRLFELKPLSLIPDLEATLVFISTEQGGRHKPAGQGYRPQFRYNDQDWDARYEFPDQPEALPGQTVRALVEFLSPRQHLGKIQVGMPFEIREGTRVVALGQVARLHRQNNLVKSGTFCLGCDRMLGREYNHYHCPRCWSSPEHHEVRNFDRMWGDGDVCCVHCDVTVRSFDSG